MTLIKVGEKDGKEIFVREGLSEKAKRMLDLGPGKIIGSFDSAEVEIIPPKTIFTYVKGKCFSCGAESGKYKYCNGPCCVKAPYQSSDLNCHMERREEI